MGERICRTRLITMPDGSQIRRPVWTNKHMGQFKVIGMLRPQGGDVKYLCQCACGNKMRCSYEEINSGAVIKCPRCTAEELAEIKNKFAPRTSADAEWSFATVVDKELLNRFKVYRDRIPAWWWKCLNVVVDEICQMLAREELPDAEVAKWFECPVECIDIVRDCYGKRIKRIHKDYQAIKKQFSHIKRIPSEISAHEVHTMLSLVFSSKRGLLIDDGY